MTEARKARSSAGSTLVLGASGWIGREVLRVAHQSGPAIGAARRANLAGYRTVTDSQELERAIREEDVHLVVNCAGRTSGSEADLVNANVELATAVGQVCLSIGVRLVHVGSAAEYGGGHDEVVRETSATEPRSAYGRAKLAGTQALLRLADQGLDVTVARAFNVIGPGQPLSTPVGEFAAAVRAIHAPGGEVVVRDATLVRDFVSTTFVANALLRLGRAERRAALVNVCSGRGVSFAELIQAMAAVRGVAVHIVSTEPGGITRVVGDPTLLRTLIGPAEPEDVEELARQGLEPSP